MPLEVRGLPGQHSAIPQPLSGDNMLVWPSPANGSPSWTGSAYKQRPGSGTSSTRRQAGERPSVVLATTLTSACCNYDLSDTPQLLERTLQPNPQVLRRLLQRRLGGRAPLQRFPDQRLCTLLELLP